MYLSRSRVLVALSLGLLGAAVYLAIDLNRSGRREVLRQFNTLQSLLAKQAVHEVAAYLDHCGDDLLALARMASVQRLDPARMAADVKAYYGRGEHNQPVSITLLDPKGARIYSTATTAALPNLSGSAVLDWSRKRENRGKVFVSSCAGLPKDQLDQLGEGRFLLATPVYGPNPDPTAGPASRIESGVLLATLDFESVLTEHLAVMTPQANSLRVWIMDQDGTILLQSEHPEMARENIFRTGPQCAQCHVSFDYAQNMLVGRLGVTEYQLKGQPRKLAAFAPLQFANASWVVVVNAPYAGVTAFVFRNYAKMLLLVGLLLAALGLASVAVHRAEVSKVKAETEARHWQEKLGLEEELRRAENRYRTLFEQSPAGIVMMDPESTLPVEFNTAAHRQLGYTREEFARLRLADYEMAGTPEALGARLADLLRQGVTSFETRHCTKGGELRNVEVIAQTLTLADRRVLHCIYHDLTARQRAQEALERRTAQLEALHQVNLGITSEVEPATLFQTITRQALRLFRGTAGGLFLHRPEQEALELVVRVGCDAPAGAVWLRKGEDLAGRVWESAAPLLVADYPNWDGQAGVTKRHGCAAAMAAPIRWRDTFLGVLDICSDTLGFFTRDDAALLELFATQAAIAIKNATLLEQERRDAAIKTTLLHDVNHRVKNNLMHLVEIIRLQRGQAPPAEGDFHMALGGLESRLRGMQIVHTMLSNAQWSPLPLNDMVTRIVDAALSGSPNRQQLQVSVVAPVEPLRVVPEQATAVGLILNELATNSVKYAFRNRAQGRLDVRLRVEDAGPGRPLVRLEYRDDGPGWPEGVLRGEGRAIGLRLIQASVRSPLRGELALRNENGAVAEVAFKLALPD